MAVAAVDRTGREDDPDLDDIGSPDALDPPQIHLAADGGAVIGIVVDLDNIFCSYIATPQGN